MENRRKKNCVIDITQFLCINGLNVIHYVGYRQPCILSRLCARMDKNQSSRVIWISIGKRGNSMKKRESCPFDTENSQFMYDICLMVKKVFGAVGYILN